MTENVPWLVKFLKKTFYSRFFLARLTRVPLLGKIMDYFFFEDDDIIYLPKDSVVPVNQKVTSQSMVLPSQVVEYFIEKANYHWVMNFCICRESSRCTDYPRELGCLFLGEAVLGIDPRLGRKVTKEEALDHVRKCREAGLVHLIGRNKLDAVWLQVRPGHKLLTICNCCPCCCLWKMLPDLAPDIGGKVTGMPGVVVRVTDTCVGCRTCENVCFVHAIRVVGNRAVINSECRGCGRCVDVCPQKALEITIEGDSLEKSIDRIAGLADIS